MRNNELPTYNFGKMTDTLKEKPYDAASLVPGSRRMAPSTFLMPSLSSCH